MDNLRFIFKAPLKNNNDNLSQSVGDIIKVDATLREQYTIEANITDNEIESGFTLTDHIHILPQKLSITGVISEAPTNVVSTLLKKPAEFAINAVSDNFLPSSAEGIQKRIAIAGSGALSNRFLGTNRGNIQKSYWADVIKARFLEGKEFEIVTGVDSIPNCFFESVTWNREYGQGQSLIFEAVIKEIRIVRSDVSPYTGSSPSAQPIKNLGKTVTEFLNPNGSEYTEVLNRGIPDIAERTRQVSSGILNNLGKVQKALSIFGL